MNSNRNLFFVILSVVVLAGLIFYAVTRGPAGETDTELDTEEDVFVAGVGEACFLKETSGVASDGQPAKDYHFISVNYDPENEIHGIKNWLPAEKDSQVGSYTGSAERYGGMPGYPVKLDVIYAGMGEGMSYYQQEVILVGENDIRIGGGERFLDADGVYKFKNADVLVYEESLPKIDCSLVPQTVGTDYSISK